MTAKNPLELPLPVVVDNLLPLLSSRDLTCLRSVSKQAKALVEDELLWKRKVLADFSFPAHATARMGGWFNLYKGLSHPHVYVWGSADNGRMGIDYEELGDRLGSGPHPDAGIPYPMKLRTIGSVPTQARRLGTEQDDEPQLGAVVEIVAGGWSFHARTSTGRVWSWGTMDGERYGGLRASMRHPGTERRTPHLMHDLPPIQSLSGGRCHAVALTYDNRILEWRAWGTIWELEGFPTSITGASSSSAAAGPSTSNIQQLEAGWSFSAVLTHSGQVWLWYSDWSADSFNRAYYRGHPLEEAMYGDPPGNEHLPRLPITVAPIQLPSMEQQQQQQQQNKQDFGNSDKIVQIAAGEDFVIALTQAGALYRIDLHLPAPTAEDHHAIERLRESMDGADQRDIGAKIHQALMTRFVQTRARWERLSAFEDPAPLPGFDTAWLENKRGVRGTVGKISHISAHFRQFVAFYTVQQDVGEAQAEEAQTLVLLGTSTSAEPQLIPELQARGVIKVTMGDYHYGALTQKGEILTWGAWSRGALGNWPAPWRPTAATTAHEAESEDRAAPEAQEVGEQGEGDEGDRGWFGNLVPLPRMFGAPQRGVFQPRIGFAGRGRVGRAAAAPRPAGPSQGDVATPTLIHIHPEPAGEGATQSDGTPFAFDLAFAGWHSSALVMDAPAAGS
ncbi:related to SAF1-protein involved in proteasome-dependent degradation [Sporisorium reilianum f. sp. reilianum]|uniref:Related to SAF1-protein involved in proteasome-dependent degradation n=1 Tax=Sporisorium reilianum f. sp. reilianum TaxID=72559 RepID=A0A2N8UM27_9BASI|nr:related to SAF1-protein involved in proteasome-dependent degradation [Sporisorium reilianum f. sp. reilianum]